MPLELLQRLDALLALLLPIPPLYFFALLHKLLDVVEGNVSQLSKHIDLRLLFLAISALLRL